MISSGKETELNISLTENIQQLNEVTVSSRRNRFGAQNEFASVSARSFSVEEAKRYAATVSDPARMAMNFMGVSGSNDRENGIVVRGNSPKGVLWRLEGIEIPNPNHFSSLGTSGGAVSMLNANTLAATDFYTGAFPAEIGAALSGAFDLQFRNGNQERREHSVQIGTLGAEIATEGPFRKGRQASYLINYRYSTLTLLQGFFDLGGVLPAYQDFSFKLNLPTKKAGTFSLWGLWGYNVASKDAVADSTEWGFSNPNFSLRAYGEMGVAGISHQYFINSHSYIKTVVSLARDSYKSDIDSLNPTNNYAKVPTQHARHINDYYRGTVMYNNKLSSRHTVRAGLVAQQISADMHEAYHDEELGQWIEFIKGNGSSQYYQAYLQWKSRLTEQLTLITGVHGSYYYLTEKGTVEPRASLSYQRNKSTFALSAGFHSKPEHISVYLFQNDSFGNVMRKTNKDLDVLKAFHTIGGYETSLPLKMRLKAEVYYQYLYSIPVEMDSNTAFSMLNTQNIYSLAEINKPLSSTGTGRNYGIDLSIERPFANNYYVMVSGSLFRALYTSYAGDEYNTLFNRGYQLNVLGGKEFKLNSNGSRILGINGKTLYSGGLRESKIDLARSMQYEQLMIVPGQYYTKQGMPYFRIDGSVYYKFNRRHATHSLQLDVQNITNRRNYFYSYFDGTNGRIATVYQTGIIPTIAYRIDFHW
jgi:hypothetical protein